MSDYPVYPDLNWRGIHEEEIEADKPLASHIGHHLSSVVHTLYEHLADTSIQPDMIQSVDGHAHGHSLVGGQSDSVHVPRDMRINLAGVIYRQSTAAGPSTPLNVIMMPLCGNLIFSPNSPTEFISTIRSPFYCTMNADQLSLSVNVMQSGGATGVIELAVYPENDPLSISAALDTATADIEIGNTEPTMKTLTIDIGKQVQWNGRLLLGFRLWRSNDQGYVYVEAADHWCENATENGNGDLSNCAWMV